MPVDTHCAHVVFVHQANCIIAFMVITLLIIKEFSRFISNTAIVPQKTLTVNVTASIQSIVNLTQVHTCLEILLAEGTYWPNSHSGRNLLAKQSCQLFDEVPLGHHTGLIYT